jgi:hypothetical protein
MFKTKSELLEAVIKALPYPQHITELDLSAEDSIRLVWRKSNKFRISLSGFVEEVGDGVLIGSDISILFEALLKNVYMHSK